MTTPPDLHPATEAPARHAVRDVMAGLTLALGLGLLLYAAFLASMALGVAALGALCIAVGLVLAYEPTGRRPDSPA